MFADKTRPLLQGERLAAFGLMEEGIDSLRFAVAFAQYILSERHSAVRRRGKVLGYCDCYGRVIE
ncbi:MAG: hypothetical protein LBU13_07145 [Synergistaceae bacterium]|nr:hypothetical protein [Synergistaceae bacterium]